jgi:hypothetical protein
MRRKIYTSYTSHLLLQKILDFRFAVARSFPTESQIGNRKSKILYPCRCLCFGFVQITLTTPLRWMILQLSHIFFTEARTFILLPSPLTFFAAARARPAAYL